MLVTLPKNIDDKMFATFPKNIDEYWQQFQKIIDKKMKKTKGIWELGI
jgi:hypothetical protein